jgi:lysophospholipase L1-like esterase
MFPPNTTLLFQGDSITDGGRIRQPDPKENMGQSYAFLIAARLMADYPERNLHCINRGISGNRIVDLNDRWDTEALNLKPDVLSILVGVNDVGHAFSRNSGVPADVFERVYRTLLIETRYRLPNVQLILCDPFVLGVGERLSRWEEWRHELDLRIASVQKLAAEFNAIHIPFQAIFDEACKKAAPKYWLHDGIHPTPAGHELIARKWVEAVKVAVGQPQ